jgi:DNA-binding Lrp family transcriptional regulator
VGKVNSIKLDSYDIAIIDALRKDSTLTNAQLGEIANLSASQCSRRRSRLENDGVILGYGAKLNEAALGYGLRAMTRVNLSSHNEKSALEFARFLEVHSEVRSAFSVSGDADYVLVIVTRDLDSFAEFIHRHLLPQKHVAQVRSEIVLITLKDLS